MRRRSHHGRSPRAVVAGGTSILSALDEDALVEVLHVAKGSGTLAPLASTSRQLCELARGRVPVSLRVLEGEHAAFILRSQAFGRAPFRACTELEVQAADIVRCPLVGGVLGAAQAWPALEELKVYLPSWQKQLPPNVLSDMYAASTLSHLPALQQLRRLHLHVPIFGQCCAALVAQLTQLTHLKLNEESPSDEGLPELARGHAAADLGALSRLTNLVQLVLSWPPTVVPAAGATGPFSLPSSLTSLVLDADELLLAGSMVCWVTHLPGCPQLQHLRLCYGLMQHSSTHPRALVTLLAQHNPRLRTLEFCFEDDEPNAVNWGHHAAGPPAAAAGPLMTDIPWRPDASLAGLRELRDLRTGYSMEAGDQADWQQLQRLTGLSRLAHLVVSSVPEQHMGTSLVHLDCKLTLDGYELGRLLLACPALQEANIRFYRLGAAAAVPPAATPLPAHPTLQTCSLTDWHRWREPAAAAAAAAADAAEGAAVEAAVQQFAALAPVLQHVSDLALLGWPTGSSSSSRPGSTGLPDLSPCVAVTALQFSRWWCATAPGWEQEEVLLMLAPLVRLQQLKLQSMTRVSARVVVPLQLMLPQLQQVTLYYCGKMLPVRAQHTNAERQQQQQEEAQALTRLRQLLRPGLQLEVLG